jgi:hypothetical protein
MVSDVDVLDVRVVYRIAGEGDRAHVVAPNGGGGILSET